MAQVDGVLAGQYDYRELSSPTGPIAYPAGFCWFYAALRLLHLRTIHVQMIFGILYLVNLWLVLQIYRRAQVPGWLLALCMLSKRVHSIFVLRLFNDAVAQLFMYGAMLLFLRGRHLSSSLGYSFAVSVKMQPLLYCPAVGLCLVLCGGWSHALICISAMIAGQLAVAYPFLQVNPRAYLERAFGGPGDLQHAWSVNWRFLPEFVFHSRIFTLGLLSVNICVLLWFAQVSWIPGGFLGKSIRKWSCTSRLNDCRAVALWFTCNFVSVVCLRTLHFQYLVWYFHSVPFLAWYALQPERHGPGFFWALSCVAVLGLTLAVELPYLITGHGQVRGPDGRSWNTAGVPKPIGSIVLQVAHCLLLGLLVRRAVNTDSKDEVIHNEKSD